MHNNTGENVMKVALDSTNRAENWLSYGRTDLREKSKSNVL
jgi:hypothetical protein